MHRTIDPTPSKTEQGREELRNELELQLGALLTRAKVSGFVITVDLQPDWPLRTGNYRMVGDVRHDRQHYPGSRS